MVQLKLPVNNIFHSRSTECFFVHHTILVYSHIVVFNLDCNLFSIFFLTNLITVYFFFGLVICLFQLAFLILFVLSVLHKNFSSKGNVDSK